MQKIIFYQEVQPKAADALWLHHGYYSNGNKKESISIDYIQNGVVRHIMDAGSGSGSASDGYKAYIKLNPSSEVREAKEGVSFTNATDAAQALGISEQDFLKFFSDQMPTSVGITDGLEKVLLNLVAHESSDAEEYIRGVSAYIGHYYTANHSKTFTIEISASQNDDDEQEYNIFMSVMTQAEVG